jgi:plastocyanin
MRTSSQLVPPGPRVWRLVIRLGHGRSLEFTKPGTYSYVCILHPGMAGQVDVTA